MRLSLNPDFTAAIADFIPPDDGRAPTLPIGDVASRRDTVNDLFDFMTSRWSDSPDVDVEQSSVQAEDGTGFEIPLYRFTMRKTVTGSSNVRDGNANRNSAVVYIRGGGYICLSVPHYFKVIKNYVSMSGVQFFAVDYRSAPGNPFPTPVEDCYTVLKHVSSFAKDFGVDPSRLVIMGDSAGGGLCAATTILARDRGRSPPLKKQIIINGNLDDRNVKPRTHAEMAKFTTWTMEDNMTGWAAYLGQGHEKKDNVPGFASPARVESAKGLPDTYLDVPYLDILRDEGVDYAKRIMREAREFDVELHLWPGVPHSFEFFAPKMGLAQMAFSARVAAIGRV